MEIISKTQITEPLMWPQTAVVIITIAAVIGVLVYSFMTSKYERGTKGLFWIIAVSIPAFIAAVAICNIIRIDTGRYRYEATLDDTYAANDLFEEYTNISYEDGVYSFEDKHQ